MRIAAIDIETAPATAYVWRTGQQFVGLEQITEPSRMICFAARFNDRKRTEFYSEWDDGHQGMVEQARRILDEADVILHFNGKRFDDPWLRAEIKMAGLLPPSPYKQIDLYQQTKQFRLDSHKLQHVLTHLLKLEGKVQHSGFNLWRKVLDGDEKARRLFKRYNIRDVDALWEAFEELKPWLKLPNANLYAPGTDRVCPKCGKEALQSRGYYHLATGTYPRWWCDPAKGGCGGWSRGTHRVASTDVREVA